MTWLAWRQFRAQAVAATAFLVAVATYLLVSGVRMHHTYAADMAACVGRPGCGSTLSILQDYDSAFHLIELVVLAVPALIGIFWGAPLVGRELETGTTQLAWNQSVTRTRWLAVKLAVLGAASMASAGILGYLLTWWAGPLDHITGSRFGALVFASRDIVPAAYAVFAFALGVTAGLLLRRTLPAMAVTLAVFIGVQLLVPAVVRPNLLPSTTITFAVNAGTARRSNITTSNGGAEIYLTPPISRDTWVISAPPVENSTGRVVAAHEHLGCFPGLNTDKGGTLDTGQIGACLARYNLHETVTYQPANHYWPLQWYESAIFLALTATLTAACFNLIRCRS